MVRSLDRICQAGALLGELLLQERITVEGDRLRVVDRRLPADALTHTMPDHLLAEPAEHPVRSWLVFLARRSAEQVADRLGVPAVVFFVMSAATPLTMVAGVITLAYAITGRLGLPLAFLLIAVRRGISAEDCSLCDERHRGSGWGRRTAPHTTAHV